MGRGREQSKATVPGRERPWGPLAAVLAVGLSALLGACGVSAPTPAPQGSGGGPNATLALVHGTLVDGTGAAPVADAVVLIAGDRIAAAGPAGTIAVPAGVRTIDVRGGTILPGFINAHVHRGFDPSNLKAWAQGGVTTVRDEGTSPGLVSTLHALRAVTARDPGYARLVSAGAMLAVPGGYGERYIATPEAAVEAVADEADEGVDAIKVALEDGYAGTSGLPKPSAAQLTAIVKAAHERGLPVSAHVTQGMYLQALLDAGVDDVAHVPYDSVPPAAWRAMVERGVYLVPTFTIYRNYQGPVEACVANVRRFAALGGHVALGNDYGGGPGSFELGIPMYEVEKLSEAGLTPMEVIEAGTKNAAHVLRLGTELGTVEPGKAADVLVVGGDPLLDLHVLSDVRLVVHAGSVVRNELAR